MQSKKMDLPATPTYQTDPIFQQGYQGLSQYANRLLNFDFSGNLSPLQDTISLNPQSTQLALSAAQGFLQPQYDQSVRDLRNEAAANNQLQSSTFTDALSRNANTLNSQYQGIASNAALQDQQRALQNRLSLFGTGLDTLQTATNFGFQNQNSQNTFNLENYQNEVAKALAGQGQQSGGLFGGLLGAGGGALAGLALAPFTGGSSLLLAGAGGLLGGAAGALTPQSSNVGGNLFSSGAGLLGATQNPLLSLGSRLNSGTSAAFPGQYASDFNSSNSNASNLLYKGLSLN